MVTLNFFGRTIEAYFRSKNWVAIYLTETLLGGLMQKKSTDIIGSSAAIFRGKQNYYSLFMFQHGQLDYQYYTKVGQNIVIEVLQIKFIHKYSYLLNALAMMFIFGGCLAGLAIYIATRGKYDYLYNLLIYQNGSMIEGNLGELIWGSVELTLNVLLLDRLRLPQKIRDQGVLRLSLIHEYNNYSDTKVRYVVASLLTPDIYKYFHNFQDPLQFIYGCFMFFDFLVILECITNTDTIQAATLLIRVLRIINILYQILKAAMTIKLKKTSKYIPPLVIKPSEVSPPQSLITTKANSNDEEQEQEVLKQPKKPSNLCVYQFNIRTSKSSVITITTNDITQLDSLLDHQLYLDKRTLLMIKLNLCLKAYSQNNIKKLSTSEILLKQIANYQAELLLIQS